MIAAAVIPLVAAVIIFFYFRSQIRATTMRILRMEGEITLEDDGKKKTVTNNLRLNSGNALSTAVKSLVSIGLDDVKIVTLDEMSRAEFNQAGRKLDLKLTDGSLFFEVQKPLEDEESFDIRTSTMVVGIRGTSGWVSVEGDHESLIVTDGHVHVIGTNPTTGETKEIEVYAGQKISTYLYNDRDVDSIMFFLEDVTERDLPEFLLDRLRENPELLDKVCKETGWDKPWILGVVTPTSTPTPTPAAYEDPDNSGQDDENPSELTPTPTPTPTKALADSAQKELEEMLAKMLAMITPTPTPTPTSSGSSEPETTPTPAPTPTQIPTNTAYGVDPNTGNELINLAGGGTAEWTGAYLLITGTDSNGKVRIPASITDINGNQRGPFGGYTQFNDVDIKTIDATEYPTAGSLESFVGLAQNSPQKNQNLSNVYNDYASINPQTGVATVIVNPNDSETGNQFQNMMNAMEHNNPVVTNVTFGNTSVTHSGGMNGTYTVNDGNNSFTFTGNSIDIHNEPANSRIVFDTAGAVNYDGTIQ